MRRVPLHAPSQTAISPLCCYATGASAPLVHRRGHPESRANARPRSPSKHPVSPCAQPPLSPSASTARLTRPSPLSMSTSMPAAPSNEGTSIWGCSHDSVTRGGPPRAPPARQMVDRLCRVDLMPNCAQWWRVRAGRAATPLVHAALGTRLLCDRDADTRAGLVWGPTSTQNKRACGLVSPAFVLRDIRCALW